MSEADFRKRLDRIGSDLGQATTRWTAARRRRRQAVAVACAVFVAAGAIAAGAQLGSNGVEPAAAQVLERAAQVDVSGTKPRAGRFFYTETLVLTRTQTSTGAVTSTQKTELWAGADGSGVEVAQPEQVEVPAEPVPPLGATGTGPAPTAGSPAKAPSKPTKPSVRRFRKGTIDAGELGSFDTSFRDSLLEQLGLSARRLVKLASHQPEFNDRMLTATKGVVRRLNAADAEAQQAVGNQAFFLVGSMLGQWGEPMPASLRGALFRFAATLDGIDVDASFIDGHGRKGIALSKGNTRVVLVPGSYALRATSYKLNRSETTIETLRTAVVDRPRELPSN